MEQIWPVLLNIISTLAIGLFFIILRGFSKKVCDLEAAIVELRVHVAEKYVTRESFKENLAPINSKLDKILENQMTFASELSKKVDK